MPPPPRTSYRNLILRSLPRQELSRLAPHLKPAIFKLHKTFFNPGEEITDAYFLEDGLASIVISMSDGTTVETSIVGREGIVGMSALLGTKSLPNRTFMQIAGSGFTIKAKYLSEEFQKPGKLQQLLKNYIQSHLVQTAQIAACNRLHDIAPRLSRWLLMCRDRMDSESFPITHEFLGQMLGAPRTTVTQAAGTLQEQGLIDYARGRVNILQSKTLERASCECYHVIRTECQRLGILYV